MRLRHPSSVAHVRLLVRAPWKRYIVPRHTLASVLIFDFESCYVYVVDVCTIARYCKSASKVAAVFVAYYACSLKLWQDTVASQQSNVQQLDRGANVLFPLDCVTYRKPFNTFRDFAF